MDFEIIAEGLGFPEGPVVMADGSIILVEIQAGVISRIWGDGKREVIAEPGGGPNGLAIGPDGALYCCNNGGFEWQELGGLTVPGGCPPDYSGGRMERINVTTGKVERLFDSVDGLPLKGPNDIVFDKHGNFYFTDHGKTYPRHRDMGGLYFAGADGSVKEMAFHHTSPNGVGLSPDESVVYMADTLTGRLWAFDLKAPGELRDHNPLGPEGRVVATLPGLQYLDSLAVTAAGNVTVATILNGGITTFRPDGTTAHTAFPDPLVTNIAFGGPDMRTAWVTLSGSGKLIKCTWDEPGLKLAFNA
ncbi:MAG: SMP-30/gluconolactonase/LRE family protein [Hyphomonadaceae bacterium]|nr:SMP-30/gluconolactonase/LRE family protein [Hyphomonadaceae bacterium]